MIKLTTILLIAGFLQVSAHGYSQKVTIRKTGASIEDVLLEINKQTGYSWSATQQSLQSALRFDISVRNVSLEEVLRLSFKDQPLTYVIKDHIIIIKERDNPLPNKTQVPEPIKLLDVSGRIINEKGDPVAGATVKVKGTTIGTGTNENGFFILREVKEDATIEITGVNIETIEIKVAGKSNLGDIIAKTKITTSQEVVVANTGYQQIKPNETNGSVVVIDNEMFNRQTGTSVLNRLNGVTSGLLFNIGKTAANGSPNVFSIRGLSTINASVEPLIVLDNFPYEGSINNINPNDVENVTILKDAAATSIYGARGGNGVVVITTKKGRFNQKTKIELNANTIVTGKPDQYYLPQISSSDYVDVEQLLFNNGFFDNTINLLSSQPYTLLTDGVEILLKRRNGQISATDSANQIDALKRIDARDQYNKYFYSNAVTQQYSLSLRGGSGNIAWLVAGAYDKVSTSLDGKNDKLNFHVDNTYRPIPNLDINLSVYYTNNRVKTGKAGPYEAIRHAPYQRYADENGTPLSVAVGYRDAYTDTVGGGRLLDWKLYPLEDYKHSTNVDNFDQIVAGAGLNYRVWKSLQISLNYQYQRQWTRSERVDDMESYYTRDLVNRFTNLNAPANSPALRNPVPVGGILTARGSNGSSQSARTQLTYGKSFLKHSISAIAGGELREIRQWGGYNVTSYGYVRDPFSQVYVDFRNSYPLFLSGSPSRIPGLPGAVGETVTRFVSIYGNMAYTYNKRYSVSGSFRKDASNIFGLSTNDKWNPLWSVGLGWDISGEKFCHINWLSRAKLRASWGYSGNIDLSKTALPILTYGDNPYIGMPAARILRLNDPRLKWERSRQLNLGLDFALKNNRVSGSIEYYQKKGTDLYGVVPYDYTTFGSSSTIIRNVAAMIGNGVDINIQVKIIDKIFKWNTGFLYNYNTSKTTAYYSEDAQNGESIVGGRGNIITPVVGKSLYAIAAYRWGGLDGSGNPQGYLNGHLSTDYSAMGLKRLGKGIYGDDVVYVGSSNPVHFGALINTFNWKNFSASFNIVYKLGYYFRSSSLSYPELIEFGNGHSDYAKRWKKPGDELYTSVPSFIYPAPPGADIAGRDAFYKYADVHVHRADNIRLQFVNLAYSFVPKNNKLPIHMIQVYLNAADLGIIWKATRGSVDPDYPANIPPPKSFTAGIRMEL